MKKTVALIAITTLMVSCASSNTSQNNRLRNIDVSRDAKLTLADKSSDEKVICRQIKKTGSHRVTTVCRSQSEIEATRQATYNQIRRTQTSGSCESYGNCGN